MQLWEEALNTSERMISSKSTKTLEMACLVQTTPVRWLASHYLSPFYIREDLIFSVNFSYAKFSVRWLASHLPCLVCTHYKLSYAKFSVIMQVKTYERRKIPNDSTYWLLCLFWPNSMFQAFYPECSNHTGPTLLTWHWF